MINPFMAKEPELDDINKEIEKWKEENVKIIAISTDDSRTKRRVRPMINGKDWDFEIFVDENQDFKRALNITGIPHTIVDKGRKIYNFYINFTQKRSTNPIMLAARFLD